MDPFPEVSNDPFRVDGAGVEEMEIEVEVDLSEWDAERTAEIAASPADERPAPTA